MFRTKGISASNMVLLQNEINCVFGIAPNDSVVEMIFREQKFSTKANDKGEWKIEFNAGSVTENEKIILNCENEQSIVFENIAVGEVWLCSGQSNMQLQMERLKFSYPHEFMEKENSKIRMITIPVKYAFDGEKDEIENAEWKIASPQTIASMSGTGYFFAKKLSQDLNVPIGIVNASQGGTPISSWLDKNSLSGVKNFDERILELQGKNYVENVLTECKKNGDDWSNEIFEADKGSEEFWERLDYESLDDEWQPFNIPEKFDLIENAGIVWFKKEIVLTKNQLEHFEEFGARLWLGTIRDADRAYVNGVQVGVTYYMYPPRRYEVPKGILKEGKNTITLRVQQNGPWSKVFFFNEKPYSFFASDVMVHPVAARNVENHKDKIMPVKVGRDSSTPSQEFYFSLVGEWKYKIGCNVRQSPSQVFFENEPTSLYNAMLAPCFNTAIRGVLWYQGESNSGDTNIYEMLLTRMISLWRHKFMYAPKNKLPFVVIQLPNWANDQEPFSTPEYSGWALLRESQNFVAEKNEDVAISVLIDAGEWNDLHPEKKITGGTRSAEQALRMVYKKDYPAPAKIKSAEKQDDGFVVNIESAEEIIAFKTDGEFVDFEKREKIVEGFCVLCEDEKGRYCEPCKAELISEKTIKIYKPEKIPFEKIREIRYLWADCPSCINLYSGGIPVMPGRVKL